MTVPPTRGCSARPIDTVTSTLGDWIGLGLQPFQHSQQLQTFPLGTDLETRFLRLPIMLRTTIFKICKSWYYMEYSSNFVEKQKQTKPCLSLFSKQGYMIQAKLSLKYFYCSSMHMITTVTKIDCVFMGDRCQMQLCCNFVALLLPTHEIMKVVPSTLN